MTVHEFLLWAEDHPGRYELPNGIAYGVPIERVGHVRAKVRAYRALDDAVARSDLACEAMADGMMVRIDADTAYETDALVYCGKRALDEAIEVPSPVVVVEVASSGTGNIDTGLKFAGYFSLPSVQHDPVVDPVGRVLLHHRRDGDRIATHILAAGPLLFDPPGLSLTVEDLLGPAA